MPVLLLLSYFVAGASTQTCDGSGTLFYDTIGCTPNPPALPCPLSYDCQAYQTSSTYCNFNGIHYPIGSVISQQSLGTNCLGQCTCELPENSNVAQFSCLETTCPDTVLPKTGRCRLEYNLDQCCNVGVTCSTQTCKVNNVKFYAGERYLDNSTCNECICGGTCQKKVCIFEIDPKQPDNPTKIVNNCAPIYNGNSFCCPADFLCPSSNDKIQLTDLASPPAVALSCNYGGTTITSLQMVKTKKGNRPVKCYCQKPPYLTCKYLN